MFRDVKIGGHVYTVLSHHAINIVAPAGTPVYADSRATYHTKGELLFTVESTMHNKTLSID